MTNSLRSLAATVAVIPMIASPLPLLADGPRDGNGEPVAMSPVGLPLTAGDASVSDQSGWSVAIDADTAVVGAWLEDNERGYNAGSAYVYRWQGDQWVQVAKLTAPDGAAEDRFGQAVAVHDDLIVVGAYLADLDRVNEAGAAYVFRRDGDQWNFEAKLTAADAFRVDHFGRDVAVSEAGIAVGAPREERQGGLDQGAVYMFKNAENGWVQTAKLIADRPGHGDWFGFRIAMHGSVLAVGSQCNDAPAHPHDIYDAGSVEIFTYANAQWTHRQLLRSSGITLGANFGSSLALSDDLLVIGAEHDTSAGIRAGAAYVFRPDSTGLWHEDAKLVSTHPTEEAFFGSAVGVCGNTVVVAAEKADLNGIVDSGSIQQFQFSPYVGRWIPGAPFNSGLGQTNELFGSDIAFSRGLLLVAAPFVDLDDVFDAGATFAFAHDQDCNGDGLCDVVQIAAGKLSDLDSDGIPDLCECLADWDHSGTTTSGDVGAFMNDWFADQSTGLLITDITGDGVSNATDVSSFVNAYFEGCF